MNTEINFLEKKLEEFQNDIKQRFAVHEKLLETEPNDEMVLNLLRAVNDINEAVKIHTKEYSLKMEMLVDEEEQNKSFTRNAEYQKESFQRDFNRNMNSSIDLCFRYISHQNKKFA